MNSKKSAVMLLRFSPFVLRYRGLIGLTLLFTAGYTGLYTARMALLKPLMNDVFIPALDAWKTNGRIAGKLSPEQISLFRELLAWAFLLSIPVALFEYVQTYLQDRVSLQIIVDIRESICRHLLGLSMRFFSDRKSGDLLSRVTNDVQVAHGGLRMFFDDFLRNTGMLVSAIAVAAWACWQLAFLSLITLPLFLWPILKLGKRIRKSKRASLRQLGDVTEDMSQMFSGIRTVKAFRMEDREIREYREINERFMEKSLKVVRTKALAEAVMELLQNAALIVLFSLGAWLLGSGFFHLDPGGFFVFLAMCFTANRPARTLAKSYNGMQEAAAGCERIFELLDLKPEVSDESDARDLPEKIRGLEIRRVTFGYNSEPVLRDVSFSVLPGEVTAVVGHSGAGKTTLLDLIARFYDPREGAIYINGIDLRKIRRTSLVDHLAIVSQDPFLFHTTIGDNIRYGRPDASPAEVEAAAKAAHIHDFIATLEKGYDTVVGDRGTKLSGGQRQRMTIARAILKDPSILLLDEATSALDAESERAVQEALTNLMKGRLTFVIAHRHSTVQKADRIIVLRRGELVETGTHGELIEKPEGEYARIYRTQLMD